MKQVVYPVFWVSIFVVLVMALSPGAVQAQSEEKTDRPVTPSGEASGSQGQPGMQEMRGGQGDRGQMTCL
jgi:hypothetical protein